MALAVLTIVDLVVSGISVGMMIPGLLPDKDEHKTVVRIAVGLTSNRDDTTAGNQPGVHLYDIMGRSIGRQKGSSSIIKDGDFVDISVPFDDGVGKEPTEYLSINEWGDDALCIAYIALTQPDGTKKAWYGDIAKTCGADWYHSLLKTGDDDYQPSCIWIDRNRSNGLRYRGLGLHINDFAATPERAEQYYLNHELMCNAAPRFRMYKDINFDDSIPYFNPPLDYVPNNMTDADPAAVMDKSRWALPAEGPNINKEVIDQDPSKMKLRRRNSVPRSSDGTSGGDTVIISTSSFHSAKELCESETSWGYDFVSSTENLFCDMSEKKLWPVCTEKVTSACFDPNTSTMRPGKGLRGRDVVSGQVPPKKTYTKTVQWN